MTSLPTISTVNPELLQRSIDRIIETINDPEDVAEFAPTVRKHFTTKKWAATDEDLNAIYLYGKDKLAVKFGGASAGDDFAIAVDEAPKDVEDVADQFVVPVSDGDVSSGDDYVFTPTDASIFNAQFGKIEAALLARYVVAYHMAEVFKSFSDSTAAAGVGLRFTRMKNIVALYNIVENPVVTLISNPIKSLEQLHYCIKHLTGTGQLADLYGIYKEHGQWDVVNKVGTLSKFKVNLTYAPGYLYGTHESGTSYNSPDKVLPYIKKLCAQDHMLFSKFCVSVAYAANRLLYLLKKTRKVEALYNEKNHVFTHDGETVPGLLGTDSTTMAYLKTFLHYATKGKMPACSVAGRKDLIPYWAVVKALIIAAQKDTPDGGGASLDVARKFRDGTILNHVAFKELNEFSTSLGRISRSHRRVVGHASTYDKACVIETIISDPSYEMLFYFGVTDGPNLHWTHVEDDWNKNHKGAPYYWADIKSKLPGHAIDVTDKENVAAYFADKPQGYRLVVADIASSRFKTDPKLFTTVLKAFEGHADTVVLKVSMFATFVSPCPFQVLLKDGRTYGRRHNREVFVAFTVGVERQQQFLPLHSKVHSGGVTSSAYRAVALMQATEAENRIADATRGLFSSKLTYEYADIRPFYPLGEKVKKLTDAVVNVDEAFVLTWRRKLGSLQLPTSIVGGRYIFKFDAEKIVIANRKLKVIDDALFQAWAGSADRNAERLSDIGMLDMNPEFTEEEQALFLDESAKVAEASAAVQRQHEADSIKFGQMSEDEASRLALIEAARQQTVVTATAPAGGAGAQIAQPTSDSV